MSVEEFCKELAVLFLGRETDTKPLESDFQWLIDCGDINAVSGYYPSFLLKHNQTAIDLQKKYGERIVKAITGCGAVGWFRCAEDDNCMQDQMIKTLKHYGKI